MEARRLSLLLVVVVVVACAASVGATCPTGYTAAAGTCIKLFNFVLHFDDRKTWEESSALCEAEGAKLVSLDNHVKMEQFSTYLFGVGGDLSVYSLWVGAKKDTSGWRWENGVKLSLESNMWHPDYPQQNASAIYGLITPFSDHKRHYLRSSNARGVFPGFVCEK